jgi:hypothetical protein
MLTINNLTIRNGYSLTGHGGGVYTDEDLSCINSTFAGNDVDYDDEDDAVGGAIFAGDVTLNRCTFTNNSAEDHGAAVYAEHNVSCYNSTFTGNLSDTNGGGVGNGGAIYSEDTVDAHKCTFKSNYAVEGGAIYAEDSILDYDGVYTSNSAAFRGGAIMTNSGGSDYLIRSKFTSNYTISDDISYFSPDDGPSDAGNGGAVYSSGWLSVTSAKFTLNYAASQGGAIFADWNVGTTKSTYDRNESYIDGGAIASTDDTIFVYNGNVFTKNRSGQLGGAIYSGSNMEVNAANVFKGNFATDRALDTYRTDGGYASADCNEVYLPNAVKGYFVGPDFYQGSQSFYAVPGGC